MSTTTTASTVLTSEPVTTNASTTTNQDWRASLPEDLRGDESLKDFKDVAGLAKSFKETKSMVGNALRMPKADASEEDWDKFHARLGRPETPEKYDFKRPTLPEGIHYDENMEKSFRGMAHKAGLTPRQAQSLLEQYSTMQAERVQTYDRGMEEGISELKKEWGKDWEKNTGLAKVAVKDLGGEELQALMESTGLGNHPVLIKLFASLGEQMVEQPLVMGEGPQVNGDSAEKLQLQIQEIVNDVKHPYNDKHAPHDVRTAAHNQVLKMRERLIELQKGS